MMKKVEFYVFNIIYWYNICKVVEYVEGVYVYDFEN